MLRHGSSHQETAVGTAGDGEVLGRSVLFFDQVFRGSDPVVKDVLLVFKHGSLVPCLAVFISAAQIGESEPAAPLEPPGGCRVPRGPFTRGKTAVTGH